jgi:hypothetical protein
MRKLIYIVVIAITASVGSVNASQHVNLERLMEKINALEVRTAMLESRITFASFMPDFAERFHVMHRASESEDWAVASHELQTLKQLMASSTSIDAEQGALFQAMMGPVIKKIDNAISHADSKKMAAALAETVQVCNACHTATGSPFINVTLNATESLSMRHPHKFTKQKMAKHMH